MCAGQDVEIALAARDGYGNAIGDLEAGAMKATATGHDACIKFEPYEVCARCPLQALIPLSSLQPWGTGCMQRLQHSVRIP